MPRDSGRPTDEEVLRRIQARDVDAFAVLFERYRRPVTGFLLRMTGDSDLAQDLAQEVFLSILRQADSYDPSRAFRPWLYVIARNHALHALERKDRKNVPLSALPALERASITRGEPGENREAQESLWQSLQSLPASLREAITLRYLQGLSYPEVSEILGIRPGAARERVSEALRRLREDLERRRREREA